MEVFVVKLYGLFKVCVYIISFKHNFYNADVFQ